MSETVRYKGTISKFQTSGESKEDACLRALKTLIKADEIEKKVELCDSFEELLFDTCYNNKEYIVVNGEVYLTKNFKDCSDSESEFFNSKTNKDGSIDFHVMYYNGGCDFGEAIEESLDLKDK